MSDYPANVVSEILKVLEWIEAHPDGSWTDNDALFLVYQRWREIIYDEKLLDRTGDMHTVPGLSSFGRLFLLKHRGTASEETAVVGAVTQKQDPARHSFDFCSVHWYGQDYCFTPTQAAVVKVLWEAWKNGTPIVRQQTLLDRAGSSAADSANGRLRDLFRSHAAWKTMIGEGKGRGTFRLLEPEK